MQMIWTIVTPPSHPASVAAARTYAVGTLAEWGLPVDADLAEPCGSTSSELATNAVQHTFRQSPTFTVDLVLDRDERLRLGVTDSHPRFPAAAARRRPAGQGRHGDHSLADRRVRRQAEVRPTREGGKTVSIELPDAPRRAGGTRGETAGQNAVTPAVVRPGRTRRLRSRSSAA
ncbi:non-specific serine/threonine protein kinase OS=Streptomyces tendae OX=1932 GN=GUR47_29770 PE=3 SV=1 [Streptomyces tendae]